MGTGYTYVYCTLILCPTHLASALSRRRLDARSSFVVDLDPDFFCSPSHSQWLREYRLALPWTQAQLADACGVSRSTVVRWENDQVPVPKSAVMVVFLANVIRDSGDNTLQMMTWPERERNRWRHFLSTKNYPVDMVAFAELRLPLDVPDPVLPTKEEMERKY